MIWKSWRSPEEVTVEVAVVVEETSQASDTVDSESEVGRLLELHPRSLPFDEVARQPRLRSHIQKHISSTAETQKDSTEKTALAVAATAAVDLTNMFFLLRGDTDTERRRWGWTGGISVLFAFAALLSAASLVLALHTTVVVSSARRRVLLVAPAAALFVASAATVLCPLDALGCAMSSSPGWA